MLTGLPSSTPACLVQVKSMASDASRGGGGGVEGMAARVSQAAGAAGQKVSEAASQCVFWGGNSWGYLSLFVLWGGCCPARGGCCPAVHPTSNRLPQLPPAGPLACLICRVAACRAAHAVKDRVGGEEEVLSARAEFARTRSPEQQADENKDRKSQVIRRDLPSLSRGPVGRRHLWLGARSCLALHAPPAAPPTQSASLRPVPCNRLGDARS